MKTIEEEVITMSERENVVTMVRKATQVQRQAIEETKKDCRIVIW